MSGPMDGNGAQQEWALEQLLAAAADDPAQRPAFAAALLASQVYVLGSVQGSTGAGVTVAGEGTSASLLVLQDQDGPITPFFTSERMVQTTLASLSGTDPRYLRLGCRDLFDMTRGARLVLNPHAPHGKVFLPNEVAALLDGREPGVATETLAAERTITVGAAAQVPPELPATLARFFAQRPVVAAAFLGWIAHPDGQQGYLVTVVAPDRNQAIDGFGTLQINELTGGHTVDVIVVPPDGDNPLASSVAPFYVRSPTGQYPT